MTYHYDIQQNTPEWLQMRLGKFTGSVFADLFAKPSTKTYQNAINKVVFERLTGELPESFSNDWTERGHLLEGEAIEAYELKTFTKVNRVGFVELNDWVGCSPDGLISDKGMIQVKCPKFSTLIDYHLSGEVQSDYGIQMQGELWVTEREWNDFYVYHPKLKPILKRIYRDEAMIDKIQIEVAKAIEISLNRIEQIKKG